MCELFGVSAQHNIYLNDYLKLFYKRSDNHPHGWGLCSLDGAGISIEKEPQEATKSFYLRERLKMPIWEKTLMAHIRYATIGNLDYKNCHPHSRKDMSGRRWTLAHNGTIFNYDPLNKYVQIQMGETDSERILLYIIDRVNALICQYQRPLTSEERFHLLDEILVDMSPGNKINLLLYDEEYFYVHTNFEDTLHFLKKDGAILFSTKPLDEQAWEDVPFTRLLVYRQDQCVFEGTNHENEYVEDEQETKLLYQIFAEL